MMDQVEKLASRYFKISDGELYIGGIKISTLVSQYRTPLFVYDAHVLDHKWDLLRRTFPQKFEISYSVKANPNISILKYFLSKGCGLEIASGGEFQLAMKAGCPPEKLLFAGPGKTEAELEIVLAHGIGEIHFESIVEAKRIAMLSRCLGVQARVAVRVNPTAEAQGGAMRMGGKASPFGVDEENLDDVLEWIRSEASLEFRGIHLFMGTQILDHTVLIGQYRKGLDIAKRVVSKLHRPLQMVDFGGGLGIPYFAHEQELDMEGLKKELDVLMDEVNRNGLFGDTRFVIEPGRYLVGDCGIYVTCVNDVKVSRGKKFVIVDGGMNHHLAASGNLGQVIKRNFPVAVLNKMGSKLTEVVDIVGPLCTPLDVLAREAQLPVAEPGDLIGIFQSGAYARTASPLGFLSHPAPAEILVDHGKATLIRRRGTYNDLLWDFPS